MLMVLTNFEDMVERKDPFSSLGFDIPLPCSSFSSSVSVLRYFGDTADNYNNRGRCDSFKESLVRCCYGCCLYCIRKKTAPPLWLQVVLGLLEILANHKTDTVEC